jgi:hypothetical protein
MCLVTHLFLFDPSPSLSAFREEQCPGCEDKRASRNCRRSHPSLAAARRCHGNSRTACTVDVVSAAQRSTSAHSRHQRSSLSQCLRGERNGPYRCGNTDKNMFLLSLDFRYSPMGEVYIEPTSSVLAYGRFVSSLAHRYSLMGGLY